jgi:imidazolonepropionase-like amidohydrolase
MQLDADLGTLEPGKWGDFVVLDGDPLADISNVRRIASVWIAGARVTVANARAGTGEGIGGAAAASGRP